MPIAALVLFSLGILIIALGVAGLVLVNPTQIGLEEGVLTGMIIIGGGLVGLAVGLYVLVLVERIKRS